MRIVAACFGRGNSEETIEVRQFIAAGRVPWAALHDDIEWQAAASGCVLAAGWDEWSVTTREMDG